MLSCIPYIGVILILIDLVLFVVIICIPTLMSCLLYGIRHHDTRRIFAVIVLCASAAAIAVYYIDLPNNYISQLGWRTETTPSPIPASGGITALIQNAVFYNLQIFGPIDNGIIREATSFPTEGIGLLCLLISVASGDAYLEVILILIVLPTVSYIISLLCFVSPFIGSALVALFVCGSDIKKWFSTIK